MTNFELMAEYNQWMNRKVYAAASDMSYESYTRDRGAFFGSILGTLNHILAGDIIWLKRFSTHQSNFRVLDYVSNIETPVSLDSILYNELPKLDETRQAVDDCIIQFTRILSDKDVASSLTYFNMKGDKSTKNFGQLILHFFNHQTHHRGQLSTLFNQDNVDIGITDLLACIPNDPGL